MRNTITRTFNSYIANCTMYKANEKKLFDSSILLPSTVYTVEAAEKYIRKNYNGTDKLVAVNEIVSDSKLYGMEEADFIRLATVYTERGKDTRNLITKTVNALSGDYVYMDIASRSIMTRKVTIPPDFSSKLDKYAKKIEADGEKAITIENVSTISALYAMSESTFKANAREMVDHQHYKE